MHQVFRRGGCLAALAGCVSFTAPTRAQTVPSLDLRYLRPSLAPQGSLAVEPTKTQGHLEWNVGAWGSYARRPVVLEDADGEEVAVPVINQYSIDPFFSMGLGERVDLGLTVPSVVYQSGNNTERWLLGGGKLPRTALGDAAARLKVNLVPTGEMGGFGLTALGTVSAPTGNPRSYLSERAMTGELKLLSEVQLIALALRASVGGSFRPTERSYPLGGSSFQHGLPWGAGLAVLPRAFGLDPQGHWLLHAEARGWVSLTPDFADGTTSPAAAALGARYSPSDVSAFAAVELPLNAAVGSPQVRGVLGVSWAPRFYDADGDGVADDLDACMELAEDLDGFEDADGCPELDDDDDGVLDADDRCPRQKEDEDGFQDDDGCIDADNDADGVRDTEDACPLEAGDSPFPDRRGCPRRDTDGDGLLDPDDTCPTEAEDRDGFQDDDGCADPNNDGDAFLDADDACPNVSGLPLRAPGKSGCPSPDSDGDTYPDETDRCPDRAETFDGIDDGDGCPEEPDAASPPRRSAAWFERSTEGGAPKLEWLAAPRFSRLGDRWAVDERTQVGLRALAQLLTANDLTASLAVRPLGTGDRALEAAEAQTALLVDLLRSYTWRDDRARGVSFESLAASARAPRSGLAIRLQPTPAPKPATPSAPAAPAAVTAPPPSSAAPTHAPPRAAPPAAAPTPPKPGAAPVPQKPGVR